MLCWEDNPKVILKIVVWSWDTFENNSEINQKLKKYFKKSCLLDYNYQYFFRFSWKHAFVEKISPQHSSWKLIWGQDIFENNSKIKLKPKIYLTEHCLLGSDCQYVFRFSWKGAFAEKISNQMSPWKLVWSQNTFENNSTIKLKLTKYFKKNCLLGSDNQYFFRFSWKYQTRCHLENLSGARILLNITQQ